MIAFKKGLTLTTKILNNQVPLIPVVNFIKPVGLGWDQNNSSKLVFVPSFSFANNQKPFTEIPKKQQPTQQTTSSPATVPPRASESSSKPLYTARDMFVLMMSSVGVFLWGEILLREYYKKQSPQVPAPVVVQKVVEKQEEKPKTEEQEPVTSTFLLFLMCVFIIAAELWRMRNFDKIYEELRNINRILKDEVHGIQLQMIREKLGYQ